MNVDLQATARLLDEVFPGSGVGDEAYLRWLYERSPFGRVIETNVDDGKGRAAHYALVPVGLRIGDSPRKGALSLNTAVHTRARGGGVFTRLAEATLEQAADAGVKTVLGVANANSTPGFVRRLGFELLGPLPVKIVTPIPRVASPRLESMWSDDDIRRNEWLVAAETLLGAPCAGLSRAWNSQTLGWRLSRPGRRYGMHRGDGLLAISTVDRRGGLNVGVVLKTFFYERPDGRTMRALTRTVARWHAAPLVLYAGINATLNGRGIPLPQRLRVSPLNLIRRELADPPDRTPVGSFEFLDFDAY